LTGTLDKDIEFELKLFDRFARKYKHLHIDNVISNRLEQYETIAHGSVTPKFKPELWFADPDVQAVLTDMHHIAQENKLRRLNHRGDYFP
jgi:hypothetical protein